MTSKSPKKKKKKATGGHQLVQTWLRVTEQSRTGLLRLQWLEVPGARRLGVVPVAAGRAARWNWVRSILYPCP